MAGKFNLTELLNQRSKTLQENIIENHSENKIFMIDIDDIIPSVDNFYKVDDELKRSIELVGILQPLLVKEADKGKYIVISGHRRRLAIISLLAEGKEKYRFVPCVFKNESVVDSLALIMANRFRDKTDYEKMIEAVKAETLAKELKGEYNLQGRTREVLSEIIGVSESQLGRYKAIYNNLIPELMEEFKSDNISFSVAAEACGLSEKLQHTVKLILKNRPVKLFDIENLKHNENSRTKYAENNIDKVTTVNESNSEPELKATKTEENNRYEPEPVIDKKQNNNIKTEEQKYNEEQSKIDRKTKDDIHNNEILEHLPSKESPKCHEERLAASKYDYIADEIQRFLILKNKGYKVKDEIELQEYSNGKATGRMITVKITYIVTEHSGLVDGYCIVGFDVMDYDV